MTLNNTDLANNYKRNCATFNPTDDLVLNDGVLWDVRTARAIHKFDKFNMNISGVFHPNGLEVIINTEIVSFHCGYRQLRPAGAVAEEETKARPRHRNERRRRLRREVWVRLADVSE